MTPDGFKTTTTPVHATAALAWPRARVQPNHHATHGWDYIRGGLTHLQQSRERRDAGAVGAKVPWAVKFDVT